MQYTSTHTYEDAGYYIQYSMKEDKSMFNQVFRMYNPDIEIDQ